LFINHPSLFDPPTIEPWQPRALSKSEWSSRDYRAIYAWRMRELAVLESDPIALAGARAYYAKPEHWAEFVMHWMDTYDPRRDDIKWLPFVLFEKQAEFFDYLLACYRDEESGLIEKARDMGATWVCCAFTICAWLFVKDVAIGWGSRKQELVDRLGDASSIFEKFRALLDRVPRVFMPDGYERAKHATFMKLINPANGATVIGEVGDNIGRGGRTKMYFKDESAHYERPELIEAALGDNTRIQIDISSVNGLGNVFYNRREAGVEWPETKPGYTRVFVFDWSDHPDKTPEWYAARRAKHEREGMLHVFAQEVERNYSAAIQNAIIPMEWIIAARDAHLRIPGMEGNRKGGMDIADEGGDTNALSDIDGVILRKCEEWGERDPGVSARRGIAYFKQYKRCVVFYDNIGLGSNVKSEINRLTIDEELSGLPEFIGWNAGAKVNAPFAHVIEDDDESPINKDFFENFKAQAWWSLRSRFLYTWQYIVHGIVRPPEDLISLDTTNPLIRKLEKELAQPVMVRNHKSLKMMVDKKPDGTKSPNLADSAVMGYFPPDDFSIPVLVGR
jgi:phage terminase large subunit